MPTAVCENCRRVLKNPESIERGIGPVCWDRMQEKTATRTALQKISGGGSADHRQSDFDYQILGNPESVLVIIDLNQGGMSVTNNIDAVLSKIASDHCVAVCQLTLPIIYRDSEGYFDGVRVNRKGLATFYPIIRGRRITCQNEAIYAIVQNQIK